MDLTELRNMYDQAVSQIEVLDLCLQELLKRRQLARDNDTMTEFDYLDFKISTLQGVISMYEHYREQKWTQLQRASALSLQEVIYGESSAFLTPPLSPVESQGQSSPLYEMDWSDEIDIHMIPAMLAPIRDTDDLMLTPPDSPEPLHFFSTDLINSSLTELPVTRDM